MSWSPIASWMRTAATAEIDPAGEPADHLALADLITDARNRLVAESGHRPVAGAAGDAVDEIRQEPGAIGRMDDLQVELGGIEVALLVGDHGEGRAVRNAGDGETGRQRGHPVAMAHPHLVALARLPDPLGQRRLVLDLDQCPAELAMVLALDLAAELEGHGLLAVADAEHRDPGLVDRHRRQRRALVEHRGGSAGEDDGLGREPGHPLLGLGKRHDFAVDARLADAPRDELGYLAAEVDDEDGVGHGPD